MLSHLTNKNFAITLFKALSVYMFIKAIEYFVYNLPFLFNIENYGKLIVVQVIAQPMLFVIGGFILWYTAPLLISFTDNLLDADEKTGISSIDLQIIAFSTIGIFILVNSFPEIVQAGVYYSADVFALNRETIAKRNSIVFGLAIKIALGLWLLLGSRGIVKFLRSMRRD